MFTIMFTEVRNYLKKLQHKFLTPASYSVLRNQKGNIKKGVAMQMTNDVRVQLSLVFLTSNDMKIDLCQTERAVPAKNQSNGSVCRSDGTSQPTSTQESVCFGFLTLYL